MKYIKLILIVNLFLSCTNYGQLTLQADLPKSLNENSGIVTIKDSTLWVVQDHGNSDEIFNIDLDGNILKSLDVKNAKNKDWEDLTKDEFGNLFIGDFGNNKNDRKNLAIYKLPNIENEKGLKIKANKILFSYPEQTKFPPSEKDLNYDAEAFFYHNKFLYILTKNRTQPFTGKVFIYKVPATKGEYTAELIGTFTSCTNKNTCQITSAAISPNKKTIVLLGYGTLWTITNFKFDDFSKGKINAIDLGIRTQLESVCFKDDKTILLSDEKKGKKGGNLYSYTLD